MGGAMITNEEGALDALAVSIRDDLEQRDRAAAEWADATIALGDHIAEARALLQSDKAFGEWWDRQGFAIGKNDRAAFIAMWKRPELAAKIIGDTDRRSIRLIYDEEFKPALDALPPPAPKAEEGGRFPSAGKPSAPKPAPRGSSDRAQRRKRAKAKATEAAEQAARRAEVTGEEPTVKGIMEQSGLAERTARDAKREADSLLEQKRAAEEADDDSPIDVTKFPVAAQKEIKRYIRQLQDAFEQRVAEEAKVVIDRYKSSLEFCLRNYRAEIDYAERMKKKPPARPLTFSEFTQIRNALHPDCCDPDRRSAAFALFNELKHNLTWEPPPPRKASPDDMPKTADDVLKAAKRKQ